MSGRLDGRVALVTGAARGIGRAIAETLHGAGARVALADVEDAGPLAASLGERAAFLRLDVAEEGEWQAAVAAVLARWGRLDVLVNNAGVLRRRSLAETTVEDMDWTYRVNQRGVFLGMKAVAPALAAGGGGSIVNLSSAAGLVARPGTMAYAATKWAVRGMTKVAALELGPEQIRVNSIHPGLIETEMTRSYGAEARSAALTAVPLGRFGAVEEVARLALYLASDDSAYSTGCEFVVDGGLTAI